MLSLVNFVGFASIRTQKEDKSFKDLHAIAFYSCYIISQEINDTMARNTMTLWQETIHHAVEGDDVENF